MLTREVESEDMSNERGGKGSRAKTGNAKIADSQRTGDEDEKHRA
jgi:hypothetical protein